MSKTVRRLLAVLLLGTALPLGALAASSADEGPYPGLPPLQHVDGEIGSRWGSTVSGGIANTLRARQWSRTPLMASAYNVILRPKTPSEFGPEYFGCTDSHAFVYFVSAPGAMHNYGETPDITVRTVAFGDIPVRATVRLEQRRDDAGRPLPISFHSSACILNEPGPHGTTQVRDTDIEDRLYVRVTNVVVDGVPVRLAAGCRTAEPGSLRLHGKGWWDDELQGFGGQIDIVQPWLTGNFSPAQGGLLAGSLDVGRFAGCTTVDGDDLSRLLTATVAGPGNPVRLTTTGAFGCRGPRLPSGLIGPPAPGMGAQDLTCPSGMPAPIPDFPG
ncbi:hypothetical protein GCM10022237_21590 [Nocardioides ginsengisoli]|uniref:Uncharacterized protein n=1 Tax=Nocardioides ginsengisoli TaxID=363868 RepID=A0ABW3W0J2_9ACTN